MSNGAASPRRSREIPLTSRERAAPRNTAGLRAEAARAREGEGHRAVRQRADPRVGHRDLARRIRRKREFLRLHHPAGGHDDLGALPLPLPAGCAMRRVVNTYAGKITEIEKDVFLAFADAKDFVRRREVYYLGSCLHFSLGFLLNPLILIYNRQSIFLPGLQH